MDVPDGALIRAIAGGGRDSRDAEAELCRRFGPRIRLYGLRHLRSEDRARDLVQAVLVAVLVAARSGRIDDPDRADRFMLGTCRNVAHRMHEVQTRAAGSEVLETLEDALESAAHETVDFGALLQCLGRLDERARRIVTLSFHEERTAEEIARTLETSAGNVRVIRHRAVASLRRCLETTAGPEARS
jgi:RNA polymerase sigma-70 factor (ECF subfamily)